jgi:protein gp37
MSELTGIQWTLRTWNPWRGCDKVHVRCGNCYMFAEQTRYGQDPSTVVRTKTWADPIRWQRNAEKCGVTEKVFTCSWSDWFHKDADQWRDEAWAVVKSCPNLIFQILTKRPERICNHLPSDWGNGYPNVWLGSSLDPQDKGGMALFQNHAKVKFLSLEPLLGPVDLTPALGDLDWVILGGESGHKARPCSVEWIRDAVKQCQSAGVKVFVKQLGARPIEAQQTFGTVTAARSIVLKDKKGGDIAEWPEDLRVREFPI